MRSKISLPYIDTVLSQLELPGSTAASKALGKHIHWGYWPDPSLADGTVGDFALAAERLTNLVTAFTPVRQGQVIADVGCGLGGTLASLNQRFEGMDLIGLNIDPRQLELARASVLARGDNTVRFVEADACCLPLADASVDVVLAIECIFHFQSRLAFFKEAKRVLRPAGVLVLTDFVQVVASSNLLKALCRLGESFVKSTYGQIDSFVTLPMYRDLAQATGFGRHHGVDITTSTLPTYEVMRYIFNQAGCRKAVRATALLETLSRLGLLRYQLLKYVAL